MTRITAFSLGLAALVVLSGCSAGLSDYYPSSRRYEDRKTDRRYEDRAWNRLDRDVRAYTNRLDRQLRLRDRQERQIRQILSDRARRLARDGRSAYPFPRTSGRYADRSTERFWRDADRRIERVLDRDQTRRYRELTGRRGSDRGNRGRGRRG